MGLLITIALILMIIGFQSGLFWLGEIAAAIAFGLSFWVILVRLLPRFKQVTRSQRRFYIAVLGAIVATAVLLWNSPTGEYVRSQIRELGWERIDIFSNLLSAFGQILIAIVALYVSWEQYVTSKRLTLEQNRLATQQNIITQQQTIDAYFQGIAELTLDDDGLLEDFPMERAIAEGRTAAILGSLDASGKAKVLRFLSRAGLLTPLRRDERLGRAILDGSGGYAEDRLTGIRVIDLGVMLAGADLSEGDLRGADLSDINMIRANLSRCELVRANFARTILCEANFSGADLSNVRFFYGSVKTATPRTIKDFPDYETGEFTGAVIEDADFTGAQRLTDDQRFYCCAWGGSKTRSTIPGGCEGVPNLLKR
ncbi:pentapeptide repeat-containing protein [Leptolyngbya ohadii]|uniref:pentapeptide repeat-containing protein n=1 Tax=Leptolyngbya ohadii TaxID=1962290 RepID=UPI001CED3D56|nr:pentapeptide repeat-containing protein [Leptolyngbya ohadii]